MDYIQCLYMLSQTLNIALPLNLLKKVDERAKKEYKNRSELIREALRIYLLKVERWDRIFKVGNESAKKAGIKDEKELNDLVYQFRHGRKPT